MFKVGAGRAVGGISGGGGMSSRGGAIACICVWGGLCAHAHNTTGSSHTSLLATSFIPQTPSCLLRRQVADAGDPSPWRPTEDAAETPFHVLLSIVLRCFHDATAEFGRSWPTRCRCPRSWS